MARDGVGWGGAHIRPGDTVRVWRTLGRGKFVARVLSLSTATYPVAEIQLTRVPASDRHPWKAGNRVDVSAGWLEPI